MSIEKSFKKEWFEHKDCTEENCILTFIKNNFNNFNCEFSKSCFESMIIDKIKFLGQDMMKLYDGEITEIKEELKRNTDAIITIVGLLKKEGD